MMGFIRDALLLWLSIFFFDRWKTARSEAQERKDFLRDGSCHYRESPFREVSNPPGYGWEVIEQESGDRDILPLGEDHARGAGCICKPNITIIGSRIVASHNSFDHREFIEAAIDIMNGVDGAESR